MSDDIIETRAKPATSYNCCFHLFRFVVYFLTRTSTVDPELKY